MQLAIPWPCQAFTRRRGHSERHDAGFKSSLHPPPLLNSFNRLFPDAVMIQFSVSNSEGAFSVIIKIFTNYPGIALSTRSGWMDKVVEVERGENG
ncbi:MAG: hypothetical protein HS132_02805 [Planctomycetia bacterium]|nr:hypothetical protein [Planctomycetia bacterium]